MLRKSLIACGLLSALLFPVVVTVATFYYPGYDSLADPISMLGEQGFSNAWILNIFGFFVRGLLLIAFAVGLDLSIKRSRTWDILGPLFLVTYGVASIGAAMFHCDMNCVVPTLSPSGTLHLVMGIFAFFAPALAAVTFVGRLGRDTRWARFSRYSLITGVVIAVAFMAFVASLLHYPALEGLMERLISLAILQWVLVLAVRGLRMQARPAQLPARRG